MHVQRCSYISFFYYYIALKKAQLLNKVIYASGSLSSAKVPWEFSGQARAGEEKGEHAGISGKVLVVLMENKECTYNVNNCV